jgi:hypothetical protein
MRKIFSALLHAIVMTFLKSAQNCASFDTLCRQVLEKQKVFNFYKGRYTRSITFLEDKKSNQVETIQHFKKYFFIN